MPVLDPWPGESLEYYDAADGTDFSLYGDVYFRGSGGRTITSGDVWRVWYEASWQAANRYLGDAGAAVEVSWVLEVTSGSGTIVASEGIDPDASDPAAAAPTALGTFTVAGPGTLVIPSALMGAAEIVDGDPGGSPMVRLECTSGSIDVQQVKIRAWPVGGPVGALVTLPGFSTAPELPEIAGASVSRSTVTTSPASPPSDGWDATMALVAGGASTGGTGPHPVDFGSVATVTVGGTTWHTASPDVPPIVDIIASLDTLTAQVSATPHGLVVALAGPDPAQANPINPALVEGVDWVRPPGEIAGDLPVMAGMLDAPAVAWQNATATLEVAGAADPPDAGPSLASSSPSSDPVVAGEIALSIVEGSASVTMGASTTLGGVSLVASGRWVGVTVSHSIAADAPPWPGIPPFAGSGGYSFGYTVHFGTGTPGATFSPMKAYLSMPAYRVWLPTASPDIPLRIRQRGDDLGQGSVRVRGVGSRQRSVRVRGYL